MPTIVGRFTDRGREWLAKTLGRKFVVDAPGPQMQTPGLLYFRLGEGGFRVLPSLVKVPINPSERIDKNGLVAGKGVKGDLMVDPDLSPVGDRIDVSILDVPDRDPAFFFVQKNIASGDFVLTQDPSGIYRLETSCILFQEEANKTFNVQGGTSPKFYEIGLFTESGSSPLMVAYGTFSQELKVDAISLINKVSFEI